MIERVPYNPESAPVNLKPTLNVGTIDRGLRIAVGVILLALVFVGPQTLWGLLGIVPLATGLMRWCPGYSLLGMNSCGTAERS